MAQGYIQVKRDPATLTVEVIMRHIAASALVIGLSVAAPQHAAAQATP